MDALAHTLGQPRLLLCDENLAQGTCSTGVSCSCIWVMFSCKGTAWYMLRGQEDVCPCSGEYKYTFSQLHTCMCFMTSGCSIEASDPDERELQYQYGVSQYHYQGALGGATNQQPCFHQMRDGWDTGVD